MVSFTLRMFFPRKENSVEVPIEEECGWAAAPVWTIWIRRYRGCRKTNMIPLLPKKRMTYSKFL